MKKTSVEFSINSVILEKSMITLRYYIIIFIPKSNVSFPTRYNSLALFLIFSSHFTILSSLLFSLNESLSPKWKSDAK